MVVPRDVVQPWNIRLAKIIAETRRNRGTIACINLDASERSSPENGGSFALDRGHSLARCGALVKSTFDRSEIHILREQR